MDHRAKVRVGLVGYGALGVYLADAIRGPHAHELELAFVWNRSSSKVAGDARVASLLVTDLAGDLPPVDLIVEVAHPDITRDHGPQLLTRAHYFCGSPTCFAAAPVEAAVRRAATVHACWVPAGALWGAADIGKMADRGTLAALTVTMAKHPSHLQLQGALKDALDRYVADVDDLAPRELYRGPVRALCPLAPNNVNTMACAAIAGHTLGFDGTVGCLVADKALEAHVITVDVCGPTNAQGACLRVTTQRNNPAQAGAVTGSATFASFLSSMLAAARSLAPGGGGGGGGVRLC